MARYPGEEDEIRVPQEVLETAVAEIFAACDMRIDDAGLLARTLVHADLRGIHSHGVLRVPDYVAKLTHEGVDPTARPTVISDTGGALVIDGKNAMGQIAGQFALDHVLDRAKDINIAFAAVRGSNHCGALDWYTMQAAAQDMIGIAGTNALPTMAPWGGRDKIVGLNPLSVAVPGPAGHDIVLDVALGATAHGKIRVYAQKQEPLPEGWAFDENGYPTIDAEAALHGLIQPIGGHKGIGLAVMVGILSSVLSGAGYGTESGNMIDGATAGADGQFYMALKISAFRDIEEFKSHISRLSQEYLGSARVDTNQPLYLPGGLEREISARNSATGIPLNSETLADIRKSALNLGLDLSHLTEH